MKRILPIFLLVFPTALLVLGFMTWQALSSEGTLEELLAQINVPRASNHSQHILDATSEPLVITQGTTEILVPTTLLATWRTSYIRPWTGKQETGLDYDAVNEYLNELAPSVNILPSNARFTFANGELAESLAAVEGSELDQEATFGAILAAMSAGEHRAELAVTKTEPSMSLARLADLGITTRLSEGQSTYTGSPASRIHNIRTGAKRFDSIIIQADEEFSFNTHLGEVDATTGYRPELVIKGDKLIPEYGGGICQVSTTFFRAIMEAGLPVLERKAHSLPVRYYNPQGYDSTIYPGVVDLRFKNDTGAPILVQSRIEGTKLFFEFYGRSDGRVATIDGPYTYDAQPDGSLKAVVHQIVTLADGTQTKKSFYSNYKSPGLFQTIRNPLE